MDGVKYKLRVPEDEKEIEEMVKEHSKEIFGQDSIYLDLKHKLKSVSGIGSIPDGYVISLSKPFEWFVVEVELSKHPLHEHITNQLNKFMTGVKNPSTQKELLESFYDEIIADKLLKAHIEIMIKSPEIKGFLYDLISKPPQVAVIIEEMGQKVKEACDGLKVEPKVVEFKTFIREDAPSVHAHLFEPLSVLMPPPPPPPGNITPQHEYTLPILESLIESGGSAKIQQVFSKVLQKMENKLKKNDFEELQSGGIRWKNAIQWERLKLINEGRLKKGSPRGIWEITDAGKKHYENLKTKG